MSLASPLRGRSLVRRLVILAAVWSLAALAVAGLALAALFGQLANARFDDTLRPTVDGLLAETTVAAGRIAAAQSGDQRFRPAYSGFYWEIATAEPAGPSQMVRSRSLWDRALPLSAEELAALAKSAGDIEFFDGEGPLHKPLRIAAMEARLDGVATPVVFMAAADRSPVNRDVRTFDTTIAVTLILLGAGLIAAVVVQVRVGLQPLFALQREVAAVRTGRSERIIGQYPSELEPLAAELNALMAHTQEVVERQRTHVGNLAHALKTPLSVILTEARLQGGPLAEVVTRQAQTMGQHVDHHLRRARAAARTQGLGERTAVAPVIDDLSRTLEKIFRDKLAEIEWACPEDLSFRGRTAGPPGNRRQCDGERLQVECKVACVSRRLQAAPSSFRSPSRTTGRACRPKSAARFCRRGRAAGRDATPGSGLGLAIVDELARAYGGIDHPGAHRPWGAWKRSFSSRALRPEDEGSRPLHCCFPAPAPPAGG